MLEQLLRVSYRDFCIAWILEPLLPPGSMLDMVRAMGTDCVYRIPSKEEFDLMATAFHGAGFYSRSELTAAMFYTLMWGVVFPSPMEGYLAFAPVCGELGGPELHGYPGYGEPLLRPQDLGLDYGFMAFDTAPPKWYSYAVVPAVALSLPFFALWFFEVFWGVLPFESVLSFLYLVTGTMVGGSILDLGLRVLNQVHLPWILAHVPGDRSLFSYNYLEDFVILYEGHVQVF